MARTPMQSRKMEPPKKPKPTGQVEGGGVTPIRALAKYLMDRADRKDFEKNDKIYKEAMKLLSQAQEQEQSAAKPQPKPSNTNKPAANVTKSEDAAETLARARLLLKRRGKTRLQSNSQK
jgi:hypothetical protein